jgi:hypothetical protein
MNTALISQLAPFYFNLFSCDPFLPGVDSSLITLHFLFKKQSRIFG